MSKHESALAMIDEQIEKEEAELKKVEAELFRAKAEYERKERELKLVAWSLAEIKKSRHALHFDRTTNDLTPDPVEVP